MDNSSTMSSTPPPNFDTYKNVLIGVLVVLLVLSFLGINLLDIISDIIKYIVSLFEPIVSQLLSLLGYTAGNVLNKSADIVSDTGKITLDIAEGTVQNVGNLMIKASKNNLNPNTRAKLEKTLEDDIDNNYLNTNYSIPENDVTENPIQNPISSNKKGWCLVGEYKNKRGCIEVTEHDKCMSGQIFPSQQICLNANMQN